MEPLGASWNTFNAKMLVEESEFIVQLLCAYPFPSEPDQDPSLGIPSMFCSNYDLDAYHSSDNAASCISLFAPHSDYEGYYIGDSSVVQAMETSCMPMDVCVSEEEINPSSLHNVLSHQFENHTCLNEGTSSDNQGKLSLKRRFHTGKFDKPTVPEDEIPNERPNKKTRDSIQVQRSLKNATKKTQKSTKSGDDEESNAGFNSQRSSCYSSEDNSNASQELNGGSGASSSSLRSASLNLNGKKKAIRASATNPQSLYARKRRERINERLRILQNLVPNGTKESVDISTMLEETVQYVKFLQLQIKLLSSDELWMYAPIAYNGMNIGLA